MFLLYWQMVAVIQPSQPGNTIPDITCVSKMLPFRQMTVYQIFKIALFVIKITSGLKYKRNDMCLYEFDSEIRRCEILMLFIGCCNIQYLLSINVHKVSIRFLLSMRGLKSYKKRSIYQNQETFWYLVLSLVEY